MKSFKQTLLILSIMVAFALGFWQHYSHGHLYHIIQRMSQDAHFLLQCLWPRQSSTHNLFVQVEPNDPMPKAPQPLTGSFEGYTAFVQGDDHTLYLMDMQGQIIHQWTVDTNNLASPTVANHWLLSRLHKRLISNIRDFHITKSGDVLAIVTQRFITPWGGVLIKMNVKGQIQWIYPGHFHHQFTLDDQGNIYLLAHHLHAPKSNTKNWPHIDFSQPYLADEIVILSPTGQWLKTIDLQAMVEDMPNLKTLTANQTNHRATFDPLHSNAIAWVDITMASEQPDLQVGHLLVHCRNLNTLLVLNPKTDRIEWAWPGPWQGGHTPHIIDQQTLVVFDNLGAWPRSQILWYHLGEQRIIQRYQGPSSWPLRSALRSAIQPLPNHNLLITSSDQGRILEITPQGKQVWQYQNTTRMQWHGHTHRPVILVAKRYAKNALAFIQTLDQLEQSDESMPPDQNLHRAHD